MKQNKRFEDIIRAIGDPKLSPDARLAAFNDLLQSKVGGSKSKIRLVTWIRRRIQYLIGGNREDAEDISQQVLMSIWKAGQGAWQSAAALQKVLLKDDAGPSEAWAAFNTWLNWQIRAEVQRFRRSQPSVPIGDYNDEMDSEFEEEEPTVAIDPISAKHLIQAIEKAVEESKQPAWVKQALRMVYREAKSYKEIQEALAEQGIEKTEGAIKQRVHRLRKKLRKEFGDDLDDLLGNGQQR